jgi:uncharacterized protein YdeI (YjbR/CyaY-like superfamily)
MNPKVDAFLERVQQWPKEMAALRAIALDCGLTEELKWGKPCYAFEGKNVVVIQGFKAYCALLFFKGNLLSDVHGLLVLTGENTVVGRQLRFNSVAEIVAQKAAIKSYIYQAIEVEKAGIKDPVVKKAAPAIPPELKQAFERKPALKKAFETLTPGRQKAYIIFIGQAKQSQTRVTRVDKCAPQILKGLGLNEA